MEYLLYLQPVSIVAMAFCIAMCMWHCVRLIKLGAPKDLSQPSGSVTAGVVYSNTGAMMPRQKESAYKHLPTYTAGILFHIGSFIALLSFLLLIPSVVGYFFFQHPLLSTLIALYLWLSAFCGIGLVIKRLFSKKLRPISNVDDYFAIILVTLFHLVSALVFTAFAFNEYSYILFATYFLVATLLFIYLPYSKLKHVVYYFAARYHLGFFYGRRGTWPPKV